MTSSPAPAATVESLARDRRAAVVLMVGFAASWAVVEGVLGARLQQPYDVTQIVWCRYAAHLIIVFALWGWRQPTRLWITTRPAYHLGRSLMMLIMPVGFGLALRGGMSASTVWSVMWMAPVMVLVFASALLGERPTRGAALAAIAGSSAALLILEPAARAPVWPTVWAVLMAGSFALYIVMTRVLRHEEVRTNLFYTAVGVFVALSVYVPRVWMAPSAHDVAVLAGIGALGFVALLALDRAIERADVSTTASFIHLQVVFAALIAWRHQSHMPPPHVLGGMLVIVGVALLRWHHVTRLAGGPGSWSTCRPSALVSE